MYTQPNHTPSIHSSLAPLAGLQGFRVWVFEVYIYGNVTLYCYYNKGFYFKCVRLCTAWGLGCRVTLAQGKP